MTGPQAAFEVDTDKVRTFATFLNTQAGTLDKPLADVGNIIVTPGDEAIIPGAKTLTTAVVAGKKSVMDHITKVRADLNTLSTNTKKVADMYDKTEDQNQDAALDVTPIIDENRPT